MTIKITFEVELPSISHTDEDLINYLEYQFKARTSIKESNPFYKNEEDLQPKFETFKIQYTQDCYDNDNQAAKNGN